MILAACGSVQYINECMSYVRVLVFFEFFLNDDDDDVDCRGSTSPYSLSNVQFLIKSIGIKVYWCLRRGDDESTKKKTLLQQELEINHGI